MSMGVRRSLSVVASSDKGGPAHKPRSLDCIAVVDARNLARECFVRTLSVSHPHLEIRGYRSATEWIGAIVEEDTRPLAVLYNVGSGLPSDPGPADELARLVAAARPTPVIVLGDTEDLHEMIAALDAGAGGYIPASIGVDVVVEATRLSAAGGMFLPVASILAVRDRLAPRLPPTVPNEGRFTARQAAVADALWRGKSNKVIAYELAMSESTVKVHIRNIMKKLQATNRTEAAFKLSTVFARD